MKVGVIGLGAMGSRVAANLLNAGIELYVYNRTQSRSDDLVAKGAKWCDSPRTLAESTDVIISIVTNDEASESVWFDSKDGAFQALDDQKIAVEASTISYEWLNKLSKKLASKRFLVAPLVGSRPQVEAKQLTILVGGAKDNYENVKPILEKTSAKIPFLGEHGKALALKLAINALLGIQTAAFAEIYTALGKTGFDKEQLQSILPNLPVTAPIMQMMLGLFVEEKFDPLFPINLVEKDFGYAESYIKSKNTSALVVGSIRNIYKEAINKNLGEQNISGILNFYNME